MFPRLYPFFLLLALITFEFSPSLLLSAEEVPATWREYVDLDQHYNVSNRQREIFTKEQSQVVPVYTAEVPLEWGETYQSNYLDPETKNQVLIHKKGRQYLRIFFTKSEDSPYETLEKQKIQITHSHWGTRMQSHNTYFVWNKDQPDATPLFIKMQKQDGMVAHNSASHAELAVKNNDVAEDYLAQTQTPGNAFLPERFGAKIAIKNTEYAYSVRSTVPTHQEPGSVLLPVHGVLGSSAHLNKFAAAKNMSQMQWVEQEYLPKLARFLARTQFESGVYFQAHTQNLLMQIDDKTGEIKGFVGRDLNDVMFDHFPLLSQNRYPKNRSFLDPGTSMVNRFFVDKAKGKEPGMHMAFYDSQAITSLTSKPGTRSRLTRLFMEKYHKAAEEILGTELPLSPESKKALALLTESEKKPHDQERDLLLISLQTISQDLYEKTTALRLTKIPTDPRSFNPQILKEAFLSKHHSGEVAYFKDASTVTQKDSQLRFSFNGEGVLAREAGTGNIIGYAFGLTDREKNTIVRSGNLAGRVANWCAVALERLGIRKRL